MDSPSSELEIEVDTLDDLPVDTENPGLVDANELFFENLSPEAQPPILNNIEGGTITNTSIAVIVTGEQSQISNQSTISAVSEVTGPLIFERLPDKILVKMLKLVDKDELDELKDVSSQFRMVIDGQIGLSVIIGGSQSFFADSPIAKLKEVGVASCTVINLINTRVPDKPYRYPQLLRSLTLEGYISEKNFIRLISTTPHVHKLQIDISTLSVVEFQDNNINLHEHFPNLADLSITSDRDFFAECTSTQWLTACYSMIGLLEETFQNLQKFTIAIPYISNMRDANFDFAKTLFLFLQRHGTSLNHLKVEYAGFYEYGDDEEDNNDQEIADANFYAQEINLKKLETFEISLSIDEDDASLPSNPLIWIQKLRQQWLPILHRQQKLQSCMVTQSIFFPSSTVASICVNNEQTLKILHWKFQKQNGGERLALDCSILQCCSSLIELVLSGPTSEDLPFLGDDQPWSIKPVFINLKNLPQSLEKIKLDSCEVATTQFITFPAEFPNLKCLSLDINCHDPWGINVDILSGLLEKDSLKLLILQKSFNCKSLHNSVTNPEAPSSISSILKALISTWRLNSTWLVISTMALRRDINGQWEHAVGAIPNNRRDVFPTPIPEDARALAIMPIGRPIPRLMFEF